MKYLGKKLLLSGVILAMVGGSVSGVPENAGAQEKVKTELVKKTPATKKVVKKVDYAKVRKQYNADLKETYDFIKQLRFESDLRVREMNSIVTYETPATKKAKSKVLTDVKKLTNLLNALDKKVQSVSKKVSKVNTAKEKKEMDKVMSSFDKSQATATTAYMKIGEGISDYRFAVYEALYTSTVAFTHLYPNSITENGLPTSFEDMIYEYSRESLLKAGRDYANKQLAAGYSQDRVVSWYLGEFDDLVSHREGSTYVDLLKINDADVAKFKKPLLERKLDVANTTMRSYNDYVDGLKKRIDGMVKRDMKKVVF